MAGTIALVGGDEFRPGCEEMDQEVIRATGKDVASVIIVPTAAVTGPAKAANDGVTHFSALGGNASQLMALEREHANDLELIASARDADVVYFTGGNPDHLLAILHDSALLRMLKDGLDRGLVLGGSSAGAMVLGSVMRRPPLYSNPDGGDGRDRWVAGLGLAPNVCVLPHHERRNPAEVSSELQRGAPEGLVYLGIDARTGVIGQPGHWMVTGFGNVTVYRGRDYATFAAGERLPPGV